MKENWWQGLERFKIRPGLDRIRALMQRLGHPQEKYPVVHVAGTNGKGSTALMIAAALESQGLKVGLTTSPDLGQINERVMINRVPLNPGQWDRIGEHIERVGRELSEVPTFFEAVTALALQAFAEEKVDVAVVEVGLGGRWDATNVVPPPVLSVITPVAFDHMDRLGHTIEAIAGEKAGILKSGSRLVLARQPYPAAREVIVRRARELGVPVREPQVAARATANGAEVMVPGVGLVRIPLLGVYQADNLATAWTAVQTLADLDWIGDLEAVKRRWATMSWPGRFQIVRRSPLVVIDGAHNPHGIRGVVDTLASAPWKRYRWRLVFGVLADKPGQEMLQALLPVVSQVVLTRVPGERGTDPEALAESLPVEKRGGIIADPGQAVEFLLSNLDPSEEALLITGSLALLSHINQTFCWEMPVAES